MNDSPKKSMAIPTIIDAYPYRTNDTIRFQDIDRNNHVNNVAFAVYGETGRTNFVDHLTEEYGEPIKFVAARFTIDYLAQAYFPGTVEIGTAVSKIGTKSSTMAQAIFCKGECIAITEMTWVYFNHNDNRSEVIPDDVRILLQNYQLIQQ
jgi:acyl-CoA thioester hydrolase